MNPKKRSGLLGAPRSLALPLLLAAVAPACGSSDGHRKTRGGDGDAGTDAGDSAGGEPARGGAGGAPSAGGAGAPGGRASGGAAGSGGAPDDGGNPVSDASGDAGDAGPPPPCMTLADGTGVRVSTWQDATARREFDVQSGRLGTGDALYFLGSADLPLSTLDGVAIAGAGPETLGVLAVLDPDTLAVLSTLGISGTNVRAASVSGAASGAWVLFSAGGTVDFGGVSPTGGPAAAPEYFVAYVSGGIVRFVNRIGSPDQVLPLSPDPGGSAWLMVNGKTNLGGTDFDCTAVITKVSPTGEYTGSRCLSTGRFLPDGLAADGTGGVYVSGYPMAGEHDIGDGPFTLDASAGASVLARLDSNTDVAWRDSILRTYTRALFTVPGGFFTTGNMPQETTANGLMDFAGVKYTPCAFQNHVTRFSPAGVPLWSRAYDDTTLEILAAAPNGDLLYNRQSATEPLVPGVPAQTERNAFGVLSGSDSGRVLWERTGLLPFSGVPAGPGRAGFVVASMRTVPLDGGSQRLVTTVGVYE